MIFPHFLKFAKLLFLFCRQNFGNSALKPHVINCTVKQDLAKEVKSNSKLVCLKSQSPN